MGIAKSEQSRQQENESPWIPPSPFFFFLIWKAPKERQNKRTIREGVMAVPAKCNEEKASIWRRNLENIVCKIVVINHQSFMYGKPEKYINEEEKEIMRRRLRTESHYNRSELGEGKPEPSWVTKIDDFYFYFAFLIVLHNCCQLNFFRRNLPFTK